jgi:glycosyltransferase involved in cell wall biosynthesis
MKILYLIDNFSLGGAQTVVRGLMESGGTPDTEYAIALREKQPLMPMDHPNVAIFPSPSKYSLRVVPYLKDFISNNDIKILHCQLPRSILTGYLLKRALPEIKYIIHEQGDVFESRLYAMLLRIFQRRADGILACSEATAKKLVHRAHVDYGRIKVLYNFVDLDRFGPGNKSSKKLQKIAFAGRIEKRKGWREFIGAAMALKPRKELSFYLAGTGTELNKLKRSLGKQKETNLNYMGFVSEMKGFYQKMDLLVIPSHFEPMGMVAVEAMACGIPVLAADVPGLNEVVKHEVNGWIYPGGSAEELSLAIQKIMATDHEERAAIVEQGIRDARKFSVREYKSQLRKYYMTIQ